MKFNIVFVSSSLALLGLLSHMAHALPESNSIAIEIESAHYTSCLINSRGKPEDQLPLFARDNLVTFSDDDGDEFYVGIFSTVSFQAVNLDLGFSYVEFCHAYLSENSGRLLEAVPEAKRIQSSKCYGLDTPGYDADPVVLSANPTALGVTSKTTVNGQDVWSQTPIPYTLVDLTSTRENVYLETYHTHHASSNLTDSPSYGYFMRVYNTGPALFKVMPVQPQFGEYFNELFGSNVDPTDVHSCFSIESFEAAGADLLTGISIVGHYDMSMSPSQFLDEFDQQEMRKALRLDSQPQGNTNLEDTLFGIYDQYFHPYGPKGPEFEWMPKFRTVSGILDFMYVFLIMLQARLNGRYPSSRFAAIMPVMICHILSGCILIWGGGVVHFYDAYSDTGISREDDQDTTWQTIYYVYGAAGVVQALTVFCMMPQVMGEKRITIPIYFGAGVVNGANAIVLLLDPTLKNFFLLWGSVNTFVYVRAYIVLLSFSHIDWELLYTYAILAAAATTYPLTAQDPRVYYLLAAPVVYGPFHEKICRNFPWLGITEEDWAGGNKPADKNVPKVTVMLRTATIDKDYAKKIHALEDDPAIKSAITKLQESFRDKRVQLDPPSVHFDKASSRLMLIAEADIEDSSKLSGDKEVASTGLDPTEDLTDIEQRDEEAPDGLHATSDHSICSSPMRSIRFNRMRQQRRGSSSRSVQSAMSGSMYSMKDALKKMSEGKNYVDV